MTNSDERVMHDMFLEILSKANVQDADRDEYLTLLNLGAGACAQVLKVAKDVYSPEMFSRVIDAIIEETKTP